MAADEAGVNVPTMLLCRADHANVGLCRFTVSFLLFPLQVRGVGFELDASLTTDKLGMSASRRMFHRFDNFNRSYNPLGLFSSVVYAVSRSPCLGCKRSVTVRLCFVVLLQVVQSSEAC